MRSLFSNVAGNATLQEKAKLLQKVYFNELNKDCTKSLSTYFFCRKRLGGCSNKKKTYFK